MGILNPNLKPSAILELEDFLKRHLKGQPQVIEEIGKAYGHFLSGVKKVEDQEKKKPIIVILLLGPSRVGKTETGRVLGLYFHGTKRAVTRIDCVEFQKEHEVAKLIGAPPGFIGYDDKPRLSKEKLYRVIPGYQITPSEIKDNKKIVKEKEEDDDKLEAEIALDFWATQLNLIEQGLKNIDRKFAQLRKANSNPKEIEERKEYLKAHRKILNLHRDQILVSFTELVLQFLEGSNNFQDTPPLNKESSTNKRVIPIATAPRTSNKEVIKEKPILVLIFDEIEKAHDNLKNFLLHLMEEGQAILGNGEEADLSHAFIILTANIGSELLSKATKGMAKIGFAPSARKADLEKLIKAELKKHFKQEFLNRLDAIVICNILTTQDFRDILELKIKEFSFWLEKIIKLEIDTAVKDFILAETAKKPEEQVKALLDCFKKYLTHPIGNLLATGQLAKHKKLTVTFDPGQNKVIFKT